MLSYVGSNFRKIENVVKKNCRYNELKSRNYNTSNVLFLGDKKLAF